MTNTDMARPDGPGSRPADQAPAGLDAPRFDPSRYEDVLRGLASYVGAGGYNAETVDPDKFDAKIRCGINHLRDHIINAPETADFMAGVPLEAAHQRERWGADHDAGKQPLDWFWLIGYLSQKAATSAMAGDTDKALHHTISTAAALANWHAALSGKCNAMRPGIEAPRDSDGNPKGGDGTAPSQSDDSAGLKGIAETPPDLSSRDTNNEAV